MHWFGYLSPVFLLFSSVCLTALESTLFSNLGLPANLTPDLNLALIIFLTSSSRPYLGFATASGIALIASLFAGQPSLLVPLAYLLIFFSGCHLNRSIFLNHIFPQAVFAGLGKFLLNLGLGFSQTEGLAFKLLLQAFSSALLTAFFALPLLLLLFTLRRRLKVDGGEPVSL